MVRALWCCYRKLDKELTAGVFYIRKKFGLLSSRCFALICLGEKICVGVLVIERERLKKYRDYIRRNSGCRVVIFTMKYQMSFCVKT